MADNIAVKVSAQIEQFQTAMAQSRDQITAMTQKVEEAKAAFMSFAAVLGGGELFREAIQASQEFVLSTDRFARTLGISTESASALRLALDTVGVSTETYDAVNQRMTMRLRTNEERFQALGVVTRDANGQLLNGQQIITNAGNALLKFKEGTDRNLAATELFGRGWVQVQEILRLNQAAMDDAGQTARDLGLAMSRDDVEAAHAYQKAMADAEAVVKGMGMAIFREMLPQLTAMAKWFREEGPNAIEKTRQALLALMGAQSATASGFEIVWISIKAALQQISVAIIALGDPATSNARTARDAWKRAFEQINDIGQTAGEQIVAIATNTKTKLDEIADKIAGKWKDIGGEIRKLRYMEHGGGEPGEGGKSYTAADTKSPMAKWKDELDQLHLANDNLLASTTDQDREFWESKLAIAQTMGGKHKDVVLGVRKELYNVERKSEHEEQSEEDADSALEIAKAKNNKDKIVDILWEKAIRKGETYGYDQKEFAAAMREVERAEMAATDQQNAMEQARLKAQAEVQVQSIEMRRDEAKLRLNLGKLTAAQELGIEANLDAEEYQVKRQALVRGLALLSEDKEAQRQAREEIDKLDIEYQRKMQENHYKTTEAIAKQYEDMLTPITNAIQTSVTGMIQGTTTLQKALANIWQSILGEFVSMCAKILAKWVATQLSMQAASDSGGIFGSIGNFLGIGGEAAAASSLPSVESFALAAGMIPLQTGAWNVPANTPAYLHAGEMVLPAEIGQKVRGGGALLGSKMSADDGGGGDIHVHVHATDSQDVARAFARGGALRTALLKLQRDGLMG